MLLVHLCVNRLMGSSWFLTLKKWKKTSQAQRKVIIVSHPSAISYMSASMCSNVYLQNIICHVRRTGGMRKDDRRQSSNSIEKQIGCVIITYNVVYYFLNDILIGIVIYVE